jgi:O-antigen/teichoic acid export membrane protein
MTAATSLSAVYGVLIALLVVLGGEYVNAYADAEVAPLLAGLLVVNILFTVVRGGLKGPANVGTSGALRFVERVLRVGGQVALVYVNYQVVGLLVGHVAALLVASAIGFVLYGFRPELPDRETVVSVLDYGKYSWLGDMKAKTFGWMDTLVLGVFVASGLVTVYQISWQLASILILVSNAVENTLFPDISALAADGDLAEVRDLLSEALFYAGIFIIPGFFGALVLGPKLLRIYGPEFVKGAPILLVLIFARTINVYEMQLLNAINAVDRPDVAFRINGVFVATNMILNVALVVQYGWIGAAVATTLSSLLMLLMSSRAVLSLIGKPDVPVVGIAHQIVAAVAMAALVVAVQRTLPLQNMYVTVALVGLGACTYGVVLYGLSARLRTKVRSLSPA